MRLPDDIAEVAVYMALQTPETMTGQLVSAQEYDESAASCAFRPTTVSTPSGPSLLTMTLNR